MSVLKKAVSLLLIIALCSSAFPWLGYSSPIQAEASWSKDIQDPISSLGLLSGAPTVVYDNEAQIYRMWYTRNAEDFLGLESYISTQLLSTLSPEMVKRLKNHNFTALTAAEKTQIENLASAFFKTSKTDILAGAEGFQGKIVYAESTDGVNWTNVQDCSFSGAGPGSVYGRNAPTILKTAGGYQMWYSSWNPDPTIISQLLNDLLIYSRKVDSLRTAFLIDDIIRQDYSQFFSHLRTFLGGDNYTAFQTRILQDLDALLRTCQGVIGYAASSDGLQWTTSECSFRGTETWDIFGRYFPGIIKRDNSYELWYTGFRFDFVPFEAALAGTIPIDKAMAGAINLSIGKAISTDGITWTVDTGDVQAFKGLPADEGILHGAISPAVIAGDNNSTGMWYCDYQAPADSVLRLLTLGSPEALMSRLESSIYHVSTTDGGITWTAPQPILEKGPAGTWDGSGVGEPSVLITKTRALMWYTGYSSDISALEKGILDKKSISQSISDSSTRSAIGRASYDLHAADPIVTPTSSNPGKESPGPDIPVALAGFTGSLLIDGSGGVKTDTALSFNNGNVTMELTKDTHLLDSDGNPLKSLSAAIAISPPGSPPGNALVAAYDFRPDGARFILSIKATFRYDVNTLPEGVVEKDLHVAWWNGSEWKDLGGKINTNDHTISLSLEHFGVVALLAGPGPSGTTAEITSSSSPSAEPAQIIDNTTFPGSPTQAVSQPRSIFQTVSWVIIVLIFVAALVIGYVLFRQIRYNRSHHKP